MEASKAVDVWCVVYDLKAKVQSSVSHSDIVRICLCMHLMNLLAEQDTPRPLLFKLLGRNQTRASPEPQSAQGLLNAERERCPG